MLPIGEAFALKELFRLPIRLPSLTRSPRGDGRVVVMFPGFGTGDEFLLPLRMALRSIGHDAKGWGLGRNRGDVVGDLPFCRGRVEALAADSGRPVALVGWSLGGVFAREVARDVPESVDQVITFGTPLNGPPPSVADRVYTDEQLTEIRSSIIERDQRPIEVPVTSMYSRADRIVDWRVCQDNLTPGIDEIELSSTHIGMCFDPDLWTILAEKLAASSLR